jgi:hypothetical protein
VWSVNRNFKYDSLGMEVDDSQSIPASIFMLFVILNVSSSDYTALNGRMTT